RVRTGLFGKPIENEDMSRPSLRSSTHGSLHSDWWLGSTAELATCGGIVVFPVTGWWKDHPHLGRYDSKARYSLIISLEADGGSIDLHTPISQMVEVQTEVMV